MQTHTTEVPAVIHISMETEVNYCIWPSYRNAHTYTLIHTQFISPNTTYADMVGNISYSFIIMHKGHYCFLIISLYYF